MVNKMALKLITEQYDDVEMLVEDSGEGKKWYIEGRFCQGGRTGVREDMNANGRIYTEEVLDGAMSKYSTLIKEHRAFGELNHPSHPQVNPERVCIVIEQMTKDGMHYNGKARITEKTPMGQIVIGIQEAGGRLGISTRALGSLKESGGIKYVQSDLRFSAADVVSDPSGQGCFVNGIMESVTYDMTEDGRIIELVQDVVKKKITEEKALKAWADLMLKFGKR
jgi:hypothetical protein